MIRTVEAVIDEEGNVRLLERVRPLSLPRSVKDEVASGHRAR